MKVYKPVELQFYNKLIEIYRSHYTPTNVENTLPVTVDSSVCVEQSGGSVNQAQPKIDYWKTFESAIEQVRAKKSAKNNKGKKTTVKNRQKKK